MPLIKRYPNRKLYDTEAKQYITLEEIAELIRHEQEVHVVDYASGDDLTALTLTQIILEQEKKTGGFLPQTVLTGLVKAGGETLSVLQRTLASSLDLLRQVDEEIERRIQALINQGELAEEDGRRLLETLLAQGRLLQPARPFTDRDLEEALDRRGLPSRDEVQQLANQLDALAAKLDSLSPPGTTT